MPFELLGDVPVLAHKEQTSNQENDTQVVIRVTDEGFNLKASMDVTFGRRFRTDQFRECMVTLS
ncbi:hypothetical protein CLAFUW4_02119 [Fulvia fulva]|uniref:Uncharacterized protein n=1 Tax=Passalora fulva TaxID=5499 RepID=A0A9Q8L4T0_PASFU|nr:uncharacterized protein CLAFUR5_02112 [Fulvia fulva]KAK4634968.1 hypothetical protein CLAFUR4_02115 [Fulvia fulva]KAK4637103.1 hypothetical protein CLAFUR0_02118 [Fulvia fulva]UJO10881.1 hypothetical protein CLAFUR5_02112 [Fulvia fulva]WPV08823.1 hypothetical protein CLAFUW4_02119 [Fulvia fulva]WPV23773.1 hypothetical protein CLAFUW7_02119 [Fulvia fulva]